MRVEFGCVSFGTDIPCGAWQYSGMKKKPRMTEAGKKIVASVDREMQEPRLAESVRAAGDVLVPPIGKKTASHPA